METNISADKPSSWVDRPINSLLPKLTIEHLLIALIIIAAIISRFYNVGLRVMSHDETNHVVPSYDLYQGRGYSHNPVTHGPMQFHLLAATYFLFGDSDTTSRIPTALFSIATVAFVLIAYRRYLGKTGALLAGFFFLISPYMLFYGRYTRNESFVALFGVIMLYAVLRYLEQGKISMLYLYTAVTVLHFCTKETSFIYTAEILIFLALIFLKDVTQIKWKLPSLKDLFIIFIIIALFFIAVALAIGVIDAKSATTAAATAVATAVTTTPAATPLSLMKIGLYVSLGLASLSLIGGIVILIVGSGWNVVKNIRSFDLLILTLTLVLPQLIAFPISILGWNPLDYSQPGLIRSSIFLIGALLISTVIGFLWKPKLWLGNAGLFYAIYIILYTTVFTNGQGFFTGIVGSLGYWLSQQGVNRGTQPLYYYTLIQIPMYEYLAALGTIVAAFIGIKYRLFSHLPKIAPAEQIPDKSKEVQLELTNSETGDPFINEEPKKIPVLGLLLFWSVMSLLAFSVAGEKMPWLTVHIALPMLLAAGFGIGFIIDSMKGKHLNIRMIVGLLLFPVFLITLGKVLGSIFGVNRPFMGTTLEQLQITSTFLFALIACVLSGWGVLKLLGDWEPTQLIRVFVLAFFGILAVLTARSAYQANYINYDTGKEFLVYAHAARGPKDVLEQVQEISKRTTGGKDIKVAYIGDALYPYWWYFRDYPNKLWVEDKITKDLLNYPIVISDDNQLDKTKAILKDGYIMSSYKRLEWPMQDYFNLTFKQIWLDFLNPQMRQAIYNIWLNKDYTLYATVKNNTTLTLETWQPSQSIHLFIKKDVIAQIWDYGTIPAPEVAATDPYAGKYVTLTPDLFIGSTGVEPGQFTTPRGIAIARDNSIYVADSRNNRIQHFGADGKLITSWGSFASVDAGAAPGGTFNEPWGIAVGPDGSVYVTDTWNFRVQKFTADGKFVSMWGTAGTAEKPDTFWGPRGIVVDNQNHVFITDTGNNRVVIFDENGVYLAQFGINGVNSGEFDEPVGLALDSSNNLYVVDTWNQRIQVFQPSSDGTIYNFIRDWTVAGWVGQSVNNKPFIAVDQNGNVFVTDPDAYRVLEFDNNGEFIRGWGDYSSGIDGFGKPSGIAIDGQGKVWVSDSDNNYLLRFTMPQSIATVPLGLPPLPSSTTLLTYNLITGFVENPLKQPVYQLDGVQNIWIPVIPEGIASLLPVNVQPIKDVNGQWVLKQSDGTLAFYWQPDYLLWISANQVLPTPTKS